ncbi:MAG: hypothetical protein JSR77_01140 [Planctomycetes bacterium]|nr:hypothetical protein [Planctomycetota bacterium]
MAGGNITIIGMEFAAGSGDTFVISSAVSGVQVYMVDCGVTANSGGDDAVEINCLLGGSTPGLILDNSIFRTQGSATGFPVNVLSGTLQGRGGTFNPASSNNVSLNLGSGGRAWLRDCDIFGRAVVGNSVHSASSTVFEARNSQFRTGSFSNVIDNTGARILISDSLLGTPGTVFAGDAFTNNGAGDIWYGGLSYVPGNTYTIPPGSTLLDGTAPAGPTGPAGPAGATGPAGPAGAAGATGATGAVGAAGPAGPTGDTGPAGPTGATGPAGVASASAPIVLTGTDVSLAANGVTAAHIANRARRVYVPSDAITVSDNSAPVLLVGSGTDVTGVWARRIGNDATDAAATFTVQVPTDYAGSGVAGLNAPRMTIYWGTNATSADHAVNVDIGFRSVTDFTGAVSNSFRYNIRKSAGAATDAAESANPAAGAIVSQTIPEATETWTGNPTWTPGDVIVVTLKRNAGALDDPNNGRFYIIGVSFEYEADQ